MKTINEINMQLDLLYTEQKLQEKEVFEKMESILVNASPMNIIGKTLENIISKNNLDQELPKFFSRFDYLMELVELDLMVGVKVVEVVLLVLQMELMLLVMVPVVEEVLVQFPDQL